ncbi:hypothetical protein AMS68_001879 [Peltaster fructicola]|uniref:Uncharacterized protein n=1 Tax=Peltaster fructicola TaxID=286661 RepID=A0A6H0XNM6_9PEZI|nr:hypothetical protein AMS68_001879 [Peltaster fructicola]
MTEPKKKKQKRVKIVDVPESVFESPPASSTRPRIPALPTRALRARQPEPVLRERSILDSDADDSPLTEFDLEEEEEEKEQPVPRNPPLYTTVENIIRATTNKNRKVSGITDLNKPIRVDLPDHAPIILPYLDLSLLRDSLETPTEVPDMTLLEWIKSNEVLPIVKAWYDDAYQNDVTRDFMHHSFGLAAFPWKNGRIQVLRCIATGSFDTYSLPHISRLARHARTLVKNNGVWFDDTFLKYELNDEDKHDLSIAVLLTAWLDLETQGTKGFFGILLEGPLAQSKNKLTRRVLDMWYILDQSRILKPGAVDHNKAATGSATSVSNVSADDRRKYIREATIAQKRIVELEEDLVEARKSAGDADEKLQVALDEMDVLRGESEKRIADLLQRLHKLTK